MNMMRSKNTLAVPPGATIREQLDYRGMKQKEFAQRMGMSEKHISHLLNGVVELTHDVAIRLEDVLGVPANYWNNLEILYRESLARVTAENDLENDAELASKFPYAKMVNFGWVPSTRDKMEKALHLRKYFEVAKLEYLDRLCIPGIACRQTGSNDASDYALAAWAQKARLEARNRDTAPINISKLKLVLSQIRDMTVNKPEEFCHQLVSLLADCGIAVVFLPLIGGSFLHGATFNDGKHIVMGLTVRGRYADKFWFSLFHELDHIIAGHINNPEKNSAEMESEADAFARDILISPKDYERFIEEEDFSKASIIMFAKKINIAPGILLGRLQRDNKVLYDRFNDLREKYSIAC